MSGPPHDTEQSQASSSGDLVVAFGLAAIAILVSTTASGASFVKLLPGGMLGQQLRSDEITAAYAFVVTLPLALGLTIIGVIYLWDRRMGNDRGLLPWLGVCGVVLFVTNVVGGLVGYEKAQLESSSWTMIPGTSTEVPDWIPAVAAAFLANLLLAYAALYGLAMFAASFIAAGLSLLWLKRNFMCNSN